MIAPVTSTGSDGRQRGVLASGGSSFGTLSSAVLALVMCLLVLGVACAVVLRDGLREEPDQRATKPPRTRRATVQRAARPVRSRRPFRAGALLVVTTAGIGVATGLAIGLVAVLLALALRSFGGDAP
jgi:hypothetical protein